MPLPQESKEPKVLLVDDEHSYSAYLADFLSLVSRKYDIVVASSAEEALAVMEREPIGVVISDQRMPNTTGTQLLTVINQRYPNTVRILLTGYCELDAIIEAINEGEIFRYVSKDRPIPEIEAVISKALEKFKSQNGLH